MENFVKLTLTLLAYLLVLVKSQNACPPNQVSCMGICIDNMSLCPVQMSCPANLILTNLFTCAADSRYTLPSKCPPNQECWDGTCQVNRRSMCPTMPTCDSKNNVRCPDNTCVTDINDCPNYFECPAFIPVRCPTGDCRRKLEDCPSLIKCPNVFQMLCNDGTCRMTADDCIYASEQTRCPDQSMTRCPDGSCTSSKFLCQTNKTCPIGFVMCWDGSCSKSSNDCPEPNPGQSGTCPSGNFIKCSLDNSCQSDISKCPSSLVCPVDRPVRCWDFSCKESVDKCPTYQKCPKGTKECQDGSCTTTTCGTHVTCSMDAPFRCYDNTCRRNPADCPTPPDCPNETPILCWNGNCVSNRQDCRSPEPCPSTEPVKCPNNMCYQHPDQCTAVMGCPNGLVQCSDGSCKLKSKDCMKTKCPLNFPNQCSNGLCVKNLDNCDNDKNGCPFYASVKCYDGSCAKDSNSCPAPKLICTDLKTRLCPDGSCLPLGSICPLSNGCPVNLPLRCANQECIDPSKASCPVPTCSADTPIKCNDGSCAVTRSNCPSNFDLSFSSSGNLIQCADGRYAVYPEECKPLISCLSHQVRCPDGSCRTSQGECPVVNTCPQSKRYRCQDGSCADKAEMCLNLSGCPTAFPFKCTDSGLCVASLSQCKTRLASLELANGCSPRNPIKCTSGKCVSSQSDCEERLCPQGQVACSNGVCVNSFFDCIDIGADCPPNYVMCPKDGRCVPDYSLCLNMNNCLVSSPFRCVDGTCRRYPVKSSTADEKGCEIGIQCPNYKPYLCADGSCVEKSSFCKSLTDCPTETPVLCFDRTCVANTNECYTKLRRCPARNPILCRNNGNCVSNIFDCIDSTCPASAPYKCANGSCVSAPRDCVVVKNVSDKSVCTENEATCYDGTCRPSIELCPIYPGCMNPATPYKCPDGSCANSQEQCKEINKCPEESTLCEDGICRAKCPAFNGCPNSHPLMCSNSVCVKTLAECAGYSKCPQIDKPFRCFDGSCAASIGDCPRQKRGYIGTNINVFIYKGLSLEYDIITGENNDIIGNIGVPAKLLSFNSTSSNETSSFSDTVLAITSVPTSKIRNTLAVYDQTRQDDVMKVFPYADANEKYELEYEYSVLSSVVEIKLNKNVTKFENFIILKLAYDFPTENESNAIEDTSGSYIPLRPLVDVCLARLDTETQNWICLNTLSKTITNVNYEIYGGINEPGIYAVILNPKTNTAVIQVEPNFIVKYFVIILIGGFIAFVVISVGLYIFIRIYRYRGKYKQTREESKKFGQKMQEMQMIGTTVIGQTLGDNLDNIVYTTNPAFKVVKHEKRNERLEELQTMQEGLTKRYKVLEKNNENLKKTYESLMAELERMKEYKDLLENKPVGIHVISEENEI